MGNKKSVKIPPEDLKDLMMKTHFHKKELKRWYGEFLRDCPTGKLSKEQFIELYMRFYDSANAHKFVEHVYRTFDINQDGCIDFREFICSLSITTRGTLEEKLEWAFSVYDINGDGYATQAEIETIVKSIQKMAGATDTSIVLKTNVLKVFQMMDVNKDGCLTLDEFLKGAKEDETFVHMLQAYAPR